MNKQGEDQQQSSPADQRKNLRSPLLVLKVRLDEGQHAFFGYAKNISRSGMFIGTANPREPGSRFLVQISLPAPVTATVECTCEVVWNRQFKKRSAHEPGMGLKFIDLPEETADAIDRWIRSQTPA